MLTLTLIANDSYCRTKDWDSVPPRHNRIQLNPLGLLSGTVGGNYEFRFDRHHAFAIEGFYIIPLLTSKGHAFGGMYRYYYKQNTFFGLFFKKGLGSSKLPSPEQRDTTSYTLDFSYTTLGPNWGKAWYINNRFPISFRIGIGLPMQNEVSWKDESKYPWNPKLFETTTRISSLFDGEVTIGVSF
jgi:hypothetical protein